MINNDAFYVVYNFIKYEINFSQLTRCWLPVLLGVEEPLSVSVLTAGSPETAGVEGEVVSSLTSISELDCDWRMALPFEARTYRGNRYI